MSPTTRSLSAVVLVAALVVGGVACGDDEPTPEEARLQRVEDRLKLSFTDEQVECMLDQFSDELLVALDGEGKMPQSGAELDQFTTVTRECIVESGDTVPGTPDESTEPVDTTAASNPGDSGEPTDTADPESPGSDDTADADGPTGGPATRPEPEAPGGGDANDRDGRGSSGDGGGTDGNPAGQDG